MRENGDQSGAEGLVQGVDGPDPGTRGAVTGPSDFHHHLGLGDDLSIGAVMLDGDREAVSREEIRFQPSVRLTNNSKVPSAASNWYPRCSFSLMRPSTSRPDPGTPTAPGRPLSGSPPPVRPARR